MSGLRRALIGLAIAGLALGLAALALVTTSDREGDSPAWIVLALTLGWGFAFAGIFAWWRRPENRVGPLMTLVGFMWFLGALSSAQEPWVFTLGMLLGALWLGALIHMLVAFPTGRVEPGLERAVVVLGWSCAIVLPLAATLVTAHPEGCRDCPDNLLLVWEDDAASTVVQAVGLAASAVLLAGVGIVLFRRWRGFGKVQRRALAPVVWTGGGRRRRRPDQPVARRGRRGGSVRGGRRHPDRAHHRAPVRVPARPDALEPVPRERGERAVRPARRRRRARRARRGAGRPDADARLLAAPTPAGTSTPAATRSTSRPPAAP